jgi:hypothetical protein
MNSYPSWIHRVSELLEMLALLDTDRIDRRLVERLFDLRNTAAKDLLRRMGAQLVGNSFVISRGLLMARLREAAEHPQWSFEINRRQRTSSRIAEMRREHAGRAKHYRVAAPGPGSPCRRARKALHQQRLRRV